LDAEQKTLGYKPPFEAIDPVTYIQNEIVRIVFEFDPPEYVRYESVRLKYCEPPSLANVRSLVGKKGLNRLTLGSPPNVKEAAVELLSTNL
tara:strand:+ start:268 stop:540 length:273 start_codon:yes stop_codon:yes gene_type:complete